MKTKKYGKLEEIIGKQKKSNNKKKRVIQLIGKPKNK